MSATTETITSVRPNSALPVTMTNLIEPARNGDLVVTAGREGLYLQDFPSIDRRTVTPEVAGSSPVAPASQRPRRR
jgi:hypothetical protein